SGAGSPSGGSTGDFQYNDGAGGFGGHPAINLAGGVVRISTTAARIADNSDPTKLLNFNLSNIPTGTTEVLTIPLSTNPVAVASDAGAPPANQFVTGVTPLGQMT